MSYLPAALRGFAWKPGASFLGLGAEDSSWESASHLLVPVPYEATTSYGCGKGEGPAAILEASRHLELHDEELAPEPTSKVSSTVAAKLVYKLIGYRERF